VRDKDSGSYLSASRLTATHRVLITKPWRPLHLLLNAPPHPNRNRRLKTEAKLRRHRLKVPIHRSIRLNRYKLVKLSSSRNVASATDAMLEVVKAART